MSTPSTWPIYEADKITVLAPEAPVGLVTLWRRLDTIVPRLTEAQRNVLCAVGNLYSKDGINLLLRNVLAKPTIRRILLTGPDLSGSGDALVALQRAGIGEDGCIVGVEGARIDAEIPRHAIEAFREHVEIVDLRQGFDVARIDEFALAPTAPWAEPAVFPDRALTTPDAFPGEETGIVIRGRHVADVWLEALYHIHRFGVVKGSEYATQQRELVNLMLVIEDEDPQAPILQPVLPLVIDELAPYYERLLTSVQVPDVTYTYGQRLRDFEGIDQVDFIIHKLRSEPTSRRALAVTWNQRTDPGNVNPPCLVTVQATIQEGRLFLTATFRSNDMFGSWPRNAFGLRELQRHIAEELGVMMGPLTTLSQSAHTYAFNWPDVETALTTHRRSKLALSDFDPRGNLLVQVDAEAGEIVVMHQSPLGLPIAQYRSATADELVRQLDHARVISLVSHATYIGLEIGRAEGCMRTGIPYVQDRAPSL